MQIRVIHGRRATDRAGAAERRRRSEQTIALLAAERATNGFPLPIDVETTGRGVRARSETGQPHGREWYALDDLDAWFDQYDARVAAAGQARVARTKLRGDPDELLTLTQVCDELGISYDTGHSWVRDSLPEWDAGREGYLPQPDEEEPASYGVTRKWKRSTLQQRFVDRRRGKATSPGRPRGGGATLADLDAVDPNGDLPAPEVMAALTERLGRPISRQTVARLRRRRRKIRAAQGPNR